MFFLPLLPPLRSLASQLLSSSSYASRFLCARRRARYVARGATLTTIRDRDDDHALPQVPQQYVPSPRYSAQTAGVRVRCREDGSVALIID